MRQSRWWLVLGLLVTAASAGAKTYRWVDDKGRAHYGDVHTRDAEAVDIRPASGSAPAAPGTAAAEAERAVNCQRLRDRVDTYSKAATVSETDALGRVHTYSEADKQKLVEKTRAEMDKACESRPVATPPAAPAAPAAPAQGSNS